MNTPLLGFFMFQICFTAFQPKAKKYINQLIAFNHMKHHEKKLKIAKRKYFLLFLVDIFISTSLVLVHPQNPGYS